MHCMHCCCPACHTSRVRPKRVSDSSGINVEQRHGAIRRCRSEQELARVELQASNRSHMRVELVQEPAGCQVPHLQLLLVTTLAQVL